MNVLQSVYPSNNACLLFVVRCFFRWWVSQALLGATRVFLVMRTLTVLGIEPAVLCMLGILSSSLNSLSGPSNFYGQFEKVYSGPEP